MGVHLEEVRRTEPIRYCLYAAGDLQVLANVENPGVTGCSQHGNQVSSCRSAPGTKSIGIQLVFFSVAPKPADRSFAVFDLCGKDGNRAEAVVERGHSISVR